MRSRPPAEETLRQLAAQLRCATDLKTIGDAAAHGLGSDNAFGNVCIGTIDPDTYLLTSHYQPGAGTGMLRRILDNEYTEPDVNKFSALGRASDPVGLLTHATHGMPDRSARYRYLLKPLGYADEARAALTADGVLWGWLSAQRPAGSAAVTRESMDLLRSAATLLAQALRRLTIDNATAATDPAPAIDPDQAGMLVLDEHGRVTSASTRGAKLLRGLQAGQYLPPAVATAVTVARAAPSGESPPIKVRCPSGPWLTVNASRLSATGRPPQFAVLLAPCRSAELATLLFRAHALTSREIQVATGVWQHLNTTQIAAQLSISGYTVQDHLKSIFRKMHINSRRELLALIFTDTESQSHHSTLPGSAVRQLAGQVRHEVRR